MNEQTNTQALTNKQQKHKTINKQDTIKQTAITNKNQRNENKHGEWKLTMCKKAINKLRTNGDNPKKQHNEANPINRPNIIIIKTTHKHLLIIKTTQTNNHKQNK